MGNPVSTVASIWCTMQVFPAAKWARIDENPLRSILSPPYWNFDTEVFHEEFRVQEVEFLSSWHYFTPLNTRSLCACVATLFFRTRHNAVLGAGARAVAVPRHPPASCRPTDRHVEHFPQIPALRVIEG